MTDYAADTADTSAGVLLTSRTGTASADTVPAGSFVIWRNTGAGSHTVTLTIAATFDGQGVTSRVITVPAGGTWASRIPNSYGDSSGRVPVAINGTAAEMTYQITNA
jgi:hypothetical protein